MDNEYLYKYIYTNVCNMPENGKNYMTEKRLKVDIIVTF